MNKLVILLLVVCLVSVHAFVRRDAPTEKPSDLEDLRKQIEDTLKVLGDKIKSTVDLEKIQQFGNELVDGAQKTLKQITEKHASTVSP